MLIEIMTYLRLTTPNYSRKQHANEFALHNINRCNRMPSYYIIAVSISLVATRAEITRAKTATEWLSAYHTNVPVDIPLIWSQSNSRRSLVNCDIPENRDASFHFYIGFFLIRDHESKGQWINSYDLTRLVILQKIKLHKNNLDQVIYLSPSREKWFITISGYIDVRIFW